MFTEYCIQIIKQFFLFFTALQYFETLRLESQRSEQILEHIFHILLVLNKPFYNPVTLDQV